MKTLNHIIFNIVIIFLLINIAYANRVNNLPTDENEIFYDLFPGTIVQENNVLYLHSCQIIDIKFKLYFNQKKDEVRIRKLLNDYPKFWLYLSANAEENNQEYTMRVNTIYQEFPNKTCHLLEELSDINKE